MDLDKEIKDVNPNTQQVATIQIKDTLADNKEITINAYQLPIIDNTITIAALLQHDKLLDCFEGLRESLKDKLESIINYNG